MEDSILHEERSNNIFDSPTFQEDLRIHVGQPIGSATISPGGRDIALASRHGLHIVDLDSPFAPPRHICHETPWTPADVQWSPFASRYYWIVGTSNQRALVWNLNLGAAGPPIEFVLHAHYRAITDINFSAFDPDLLATCAVDGFVHTWDLRTPSRPATSFSDWFAGATQVKWSRKDTHIIASSHDRYLRIWDDRKGAIPLHTIEAHATKIYGLDWNRFAPTKIITCSLDRTIKVWDYSISEDQPERIIRTPYPVWRARHTPFGQGILAMPQRGDHKLHLFDGTSHEGVPWDSVVEPVYSFKGHDDSVKEFLWRARGTIDQDCCDNRDFQLVSWGSDNELILHKMRDKYLAGVGYEKGMKLERKAQLTRRGAPYITYRDPLHSTVSRGQSGTEVAAEETEHDSQTAVSRTEPAMKRPRKVRGASQLDATPPIISWMKGVKVGKTSKTARRYVRDSMQSLPNISGSHWKQTLSEEIIHASDTFRKLAFEEVDVKNRLVVVSLSGPWGVDGKDVFIKLHVAFPPDYPKTAAPHFDLTNSSSLSDEKRLALESDLAKIAQLHIQHHAGCFESVLYYLTGEYNRKQVTAWLQSNETVGLIKRDESSSDEDEALGTLATTGSQVLAPEESGSGLMLGNANVPLPKACGASWQPDGRLVCFFPPKAQPMSMFENLHTQELSRNSSDAMLEGLGRYNLDTAKPKVEMDAEPDLSEGESDYGSSSATSSSSDSSEDMKFPKFSAELYRRQTWKRSSKGKVLSASIEGSQRTGSGLMKAHDVSKPKTVVSIQVHDDILPTNLSLAHEYQILGKGKDVCEHNSKAAATLGHPFIADIWSLLAFVLTKDVPLISLLLDGQNPAWVMARRALVRIQRQDRGSDLSFDNPEAVSNPDMFAGVKWGKHPFSATWLMQRIFDHFESHADVQMLAMLSCVLSDGPPCATAHARSSEAPLWPGHSVPFYPSEDVAIRHSQPRITLSSSSHKAGAEGTQCGSAPSSDGTYERRSSEIPTTFSNSSTPPLFSRQATARSSLAASLSVSPDTKLHPLNTGPSFTSSVWARPFQLSSSPPARQPRTSVEENLSTSLASSGGHAGSSITWGPVTVHASNATMRRAYLADEADSSDEEDEAVTPDEGVPVKVVLKNAMRFEDEGEAGGQLLDERARWKAKAWRSAYAGMLEGWGMRVHGAEVRLFDGDGASGLSDGAEVPTAQQETVKDDGMSQITTIAAAADSFPLERRERDFDAAAEKGDRQAGLRVARCCGQCGLLQPRDTDGGDRGGCRGCGARVRAALGCGICYEPVKGLHKACLGCGHVAHWACFLDLMGSGGGGSGIGTCETGCGCNCALQADMLLEEAD